MIRDLPPIFFVSQPERFHAHQVKADCPEKPERVDAVHEAVCQLALPQLRILQPSEATCEELRLFHDKSYLRSVTTQASRLKRGKVVKLARQDEYQDTDLSWQSRTVSRLAVGSVLAAYRAVCGADYSVAFANVRPPCHHSRPEGGGGFCIFNGIAVTAKLALQTFQRVAIIDIDAHHGNGTQQLAESEPRVFYASTHRGDIYPHTGAPSEASNILNCPIKRSRAMRDQVLAFYGVTLPRALKECEFEPDVIFVVAGFDGHKSERHGHLGLETADYRVLARQIRALAPEKPLVAALAGGYGKALGDCAAQFVLGLQSEMQEPQSQGLAKRRKKRTWSACSKKDAGAIVDTSCSTK